MACTIHRVLVFGSGDDDRDYVASLGCTISNGAITVLHTQRRSCAVFTSRLRPFIESYPMPPPPHTRPLWETKKKSKRPTSSSRGGPSPSWTTLRRAPRCERIGMIC